MAARRVRARCGAGSKRDAAARRLPGRTDAGARARRPVCARRRDQLAGFYDSELTAAGAADPGARGPAAPLRRAERERLRASSCRRAPSSSPAGPSAQAFRSTGRAWAVQFHPEVRRDQVLEWFADDEPDAAEAARGARARARREAGRMAGARPAAVPRVSRSRRPRRRLDRQVVVARPFVPRADVVARVVARAPAASASRSPSVSRCGSTRRPRVPALDAELPSRSASARAASAGRPRHSARQGCGPGAGRTAGRACRRTRCAVRTSTIASRRAAPRARRPRSRSQGSHESRPPRRSTAAARAPSSQPAIRSGNSTPSMSRARITHGT